MTRRVLITGARAMAALDIGRDFKRLGYEVHLADSQGGRGAQLSRLVDKVHRYAPPRQEPARFSEDLAQLSHTLKPDLIIPTCEEVFHLARLGLDHPVSPLLFAPGIDVLRQLHDKAGFADLCVKLALPIPTTHALHSKDDVRVFATRSAQWVFKPSFSRFGTHTLVGPAASALANIAPSPRDPWVAQSLIRGEEVCFQAIAHHGKLSAFVAYRGTWRLATGASLAFESLSHEDATDLAIIAAKLAEGLNLTGQFACDAIIDTQNQPWLIECNPRATSGIHLLPADTRLAQAFLSAGASHLTAEQGTHRQLLPAMMSFALAGALGRGTLKPWSEVLTQARDVIAIEGDRWPSLGAIADGTLFALKGLLGGTSATAATTHDIEWNGD